MSETKILIADDDALVRDAVEKILELFGHKVTAASGGREAVEFLTEDYDAIILDINMPDMDGFQTIKEINKKKYGIPVLFLTGAGSMDYAVKAISLGAYDFITKPIEDFDLFNIKINRAIEKRSFLRKEKSYKKNLEKEVRLKTKELAEKNKLLEHYSHHLEVSTINMMATLQIALEEKDQYTAGHTKRVTGYAQKIAETLGVSAEEMIILRRAGQLHDIGKLVIDVSCIQKPGPLTTEEWGLVKKHPEIGANIVKPMKFLEREGEIIRHHHERIDGQGYPDGLKGEDLCILTKILTVADSFDAMTSKRSYKINMAPEAALVELQKCSGTQFEPLVVSTFAEIISNLQVKGDRLADKDGQQGKRPA